MTGEVGSVRGAPLSFYLSNPQSGIGAVNFGTAFTDASGNATIASNILPAGSNTVIAAFGGSTTVAAGADSNSVNIAVSAFPTVTALSAAGGPYHAGETAAFAVTVSAPPGVALAGPDATSPLYAPGSVLLYWADGTVQAQSAVAADGTAILTSNALAAGVNTFYASYSGNNFAAVSQSPRLTFTAAPLTAAGTTTTLTASDTDITLGSSIVLTALVWRLRILPFPPARSPS